MKYILRLLYGGDDLVELMLELLAHRRAALNQHQSNKALEAQLAAGRIALSQSKDAYALRRQALEGAYRLDLD